MFLSDEVETLYVCWLRNGDHEYTTIFDFLGMLKGDIWYISLFEKNPLMLAFSRTPLKQDL